MPKTYLVIFAIAIAFSIAGCSSILEKEKVVARERVAAYISQHPHLSLKIVEEMRELRLRNGMLEDDVKATWGKPSHITKFLDGSVEWRFSCDYPHPCKRKGPLGSKRWIYRSTPAALFVGGKLTNWRR